MEEDKPRRVRRKHWLDPSIWTHTEKKLVELEQRQEFRGDKSVVVPAECENHAWRRYVVVRRPTCIYNNPPDAAATGRDRWPIHTANRGDHLLVKHGKYNDPPELSCTNPTQTAEGDGYLIIAPGPMRDDGSRLHPSGYVDVDTGDFKRNGRLVV